MPKAFLSQNRSFGLGNKIKILFPAAAIENRFKNEKNKEVENFLKEGFICLQGNKQNRLK